jgi:hypothetical protein
VLLLKAALCLCVFFFRISRGSGHGSDFYLCPCVRAHLRSSRRMNSLTSTSRVPLFLAHPHTHPPTHPPTHPHLGTRRREPTKTTMWRAVVSIRTVAGQVGRCAAPAAVTAPLAGASKRHLIDLRTDTVANPPQGYVLWLHFCQPTTPWATRPSDVTRYLLLMWHSTSLYLTSCSH